MLIDPGGGGPAWGQVVQAAAAKHIRRLPGWLLSPGLGWAGFPCSICFPNSASFFCGGGGGGEWLLAPTIDRDPSLPGTLFSHLSVMLLMLSCNLANLCADSPIPRPHVRTFPRLAVSVPPSQATSLLGCPSRFPLPSLPSTVFPPLLSSLFSGSVPTRHSITGLSRARHSPNQSLPPSRFADTHRLLNAPFQPPIQARKYSMLLRLIHSWRTAGVFQVCSNQW